MPRRGFPSLTSGGRTPSYHTRRNPPSDYPAATVTGGRALPNSLAALSRIRWPTRAEICTPSCRAQPKSLDASHRRSAACREDDHASSIGFRTARAPVDRPACGPGTRFRLRAADPLPTGLVWVPIRRGARLRRDRPVHDVCHPFGGRDCRVSRRHAGARRHHCARIRHPMCNRRAGCAPDDRDGYAPAGGRLSRYRDHRVSRRHAGPEAPRFRTAIIGLRHDEDAREASVLASEWISSLRLSVCPNCGRRVPYAGCAGVFSRSAQENPNRAC